jgi:hypothetical protein
MIPNQNEGIHLIASVRRLHTLRAGQARAVRLAFRWEGCIDATARCSCKVWRVLTMTLPTYDIVKKQDNNFVWVEAAHDIQSAKKRVNELSRHTDAEFVIFNEHTLQVVALI